MIKSNNTNNYMDNKNISFILILVIFIIFISGCIQIYEEPSEERSKEKEINNSQSGQVIEMPEKKELNISKADQRRFSDLIEKLNYNVSNYEGSYSKEHEVHYWGGHSGATDYISNSEIFIKVRENQIVNLTIKYTKSGWPDGNQSYYEYYDKSTGQLCRNDIVRSAECRLSETPLPPKMQGIVKGCRVKFYGGRQVFICGDKEMSIGTELPCKKDIQTDGLELGDEFNIIYNQESNKTLCYFLTKNEDPCFAFECLNKNIKLIPLINTKETLKNVNCKYRKYNYLCRCSFDSVKIRNCREETPANFDVEIKNGIKDYLKTIELTPILEEDNEIGRCYSFYYDELEHIFCFDDFDLITFAQFGRNIRESKYTSVNIYKIKRE